MSATGTLVNPASVQKGDHIATKWTENPFTGEIEIIKSRLVKKVEFCSLAECVHLDHECYDTRFSQVVKKN